jgi:PAS domain S-box-containing protein
VVPERTDPSHTDALIESHVAERTRELSALLDVSRAMTGTIELEPLLALILDRLGGVVEYTEGLIMLLDGEDLCVVEYRGNLPREEVTKLRFPAQWAPVFQAVLRDRDAVIVDDLMGDSEIGQAYRAEGFRAIDRRVPSVRSTLSVPLTIQGEIVGQLRLDHAEPGFYTSAHADLALAIANQASIAIEHARLFESERSARERLEVAVDAGRMGTWEWHMASQTVTWSTQLEAIHGLAPGTFAGTFDAYLSDIHPDDLEYVRTTIAHSVQEGDHHLEYRIVWPDGTIHWLEASGRVIRDHSGAAVGLRGVCQDITKRKESEERERTATEERATLEERQRLARELHDSVSQALYGMALGTQTVLAALRDDQDIAGATDAAEYVLKLAEASIAEMRALIFELRPESLATDGLAAALERHAAAIRARHDLVVSASLVEPPVALPVKEALYRIAQEALHNTIKHAHAHHVQIELDASGLFLSDDGVGFDPSMAYPGHLGLTSMRERAAAVGGVLTIESTPGQGTRLRVTLRVRGS